MTLIHKLHSLHVVHKQYGIFYGCQRSLGAFGNNNNIIVAKAWNLESTSTTGDCSTTSLGMTL